MKRHCKLCCLLLACLLLTACAAPSESDGTAKPYTFTDAAGNTVSVSSCARVAVLFSSLADIWVSAGGAVTVTVGETVERGIVANGVMLVDSGAGKTVNTEALIAAAPDLVILSADIPAQVAAADLCYAAGIPAALLRVESFAEYLTVLKIFTDLTGQPQRYTALGTAQKERIDALVTAQPFAGKRILFIRAGSSARSVKAKDSTDNFAAAMITELGAANVADEAPLLLDGLSMEAVLAADPDYIFFTAMGDEAASKAFVTDMLTEDAWQGLRAVRAGRWGYLPKELFHYKPCARWAEAYAYLAAFNM